MRLLRLYLFCLPAFLAGCAGYQLGPSNGNAAGGKTIQVNPFVNKTLEPRLGDAVTAALRKRVQSDGTYRLSTHGGADFVISGEITHYDRHELSFLPNDVLTETRLEQTYGVKLKIADVAPGLRVCVPLLN